MIVFTKTYFSLITMLIMLVLAGCNVTVDEKSSNASVPEYMQALLWAESAEAESDAQKSIVSNDYRLLAIAGRGERIPGVDPKQVGSLKQRCGVKYLQGSTDVIRGDEHMKLLQKAYQYAEDYNRIIAGHCR